MDNLEVHILRELKHHSKFFQSLQKISIEQTQEYENMNAPQRVPHGVEVEHWLRNPRVSGLIPGASNLEKLFILMKIHGLTQKQTVIEL